MYKVAKQVGRSTGVYQVYSEINILGFFSLNELRAREWLDSYGEPKCLFPTKQVPL